MNRHYFKLWCSFANRWCHRRRRAGLAVHHNALMLAMRQEFGPSWELCSTFSRKYTQVWLVRQDKRAHKASMREAQG